MICGEPGNTDVELGRGMQQADGREPVLGTAGLSRRLQVGLRLAPTTVALAPTLKALAALLAESTVAVRLAGLAQDGSRALITIAVDLGTVDDVKAASPRSGAAVALLRTITESLAASDPALVALPDPRSSEAATAERLAAAGDWTTILGSRLLVG